MIDPRLIVRKVLADLQKGKPVPPPAAPPPQANYRMHPYELFVPYSTEEFARTFIHLLKTSPEVPEEIRNMIAVWVEQYDQQLMEWLNKHYGPGVNSVADVITKQVMVTQRMRAESEAKREVDTQISDLEAQFKEPPNEQPS